MCKDLSAVLDVTRVEELPRVLGHLAAAYSPDMVCLADTEVRDTRADPMTCETAGAG